MCVYNGQPWYCLEASVCLHYSGQNLPMLTEVNITLQLDTLERHQNERSRMFFTRDSDKQIELINDLVTANLNQETCYRNYTIYIRKSRDVITPLMMELA
uniref:Integrin alpha first immunoglubulin-like domain-containing protein n=1 Tax=Arion vulgaris TaxID=1028688 RepID=A0A0B6Y8K1_9EUPU